MASRAKRGKRCSVAALRKLLREFVEWVIANARPNRLLHAGKLEVFFDDTQLEVCTVKTLRGLVLITMTTVHYAGRRSGLGRY